jgi:hypothetical protein
MSKIGAEPNRGTAAVMELVNSPRGNHDRYICRLSAVLDRLLQ